MPEAKGKRALLNRILQSRVHQLSCLPKGTTINMPEVSDPVYYILIME
jgi:hypothetical protein